MKRLPSDLEILFEDDQLLAVVKPMGIPTANAPAGAVSLYSLARQARPFIGVVSRIDAPVSGVVVFAKTRAAAAGLSEQFRLRAVAKDYVAIVEGRFPAPLGAWIDWEDTMPVDNGAYGRSARAPRKAAGVLGLREQRGRRGEPGRADGNRDAELAQHASHQVDRRGALALELFADTVQCLQPLLARRLHRHRGDLPAACGLDQSGRIGAVGLVATHVRAHVAGRQQAHLVALGLETPRPIVGTAAGLHHHRERDAVLQAMRESPAGQPPALQDPAIAVGEGQFEYVFCQVDRDRRSMHGVDSSRAPVD